ncbi:hypothetical protein ACN38_g5369 [Penicillium nordicum]|uniref:Uncharacterized protein n=1 Tax=Penicillium nordicum TaxID=229535 RepID=A0A0M8P1S5_9EURO|nr:hypothetical protein ACN38_g5369 [Penicillium nordicum]
MVFQSLPVQNKAPLTHFQAQTRPKSPLGYWPLCPFAPQDSPRPNPQWAMGWAFEARPNPQPIDMHKSLVIPQYNLLWSSISSTFL